MKRIILLVLLLPLGYLFAQGNEDKEIKTDTTEIMVGGGTILVIKDRDTKEVIWRRDGVDSTVVKKKKDNLPKRVEVGGFSMDLGWNLFLLDNSLTYPDEYQALETNTWKSNHVGLHFVPTRFGIDKKSKLNLLTSLDLDIMQMNFQDPWTLQPRLDSVVLTMDSGATQLKKNQLTATYIQAPLMLSFQTHAGKRRKNFKLSAGGYGGFLIGSKTKQKNEEGEKVKLKDDFNLNKIRYGVTGRIGYGGVELYANYNLSTLFQEDRGPAITPLSVGIRIIGF